jgi:hypothetical protein
VTAGGFLYGRRDPRKSELIREANCQNSASKRKRGKLKGGSVLNCMPIRGNFEERQRLDFNTQSNSHAHFFENVAVITVR